jgi:aldehyde dehydrogenase (NAD+)
MNTITKHYIDGAFVESHGRELMDIINPTNRTVIAQVTLADEEDARRGIAAAKRAFTTYGRTTKEERAEILRRLHEVVSARVDDLTAVMVEEYGGAAWFCRLIIEAGANVFQSAEKALQELRLTKGWGKTSYLRAGRRCRLDYPLECELVFPVCQACFRAGRRLYHSY